MDGAYCQCLPSLLVTVSTQHMALSTQHMALSTQANVTRLMVNIKWFWHNAHFIYISYSAKNSEHLVEEFCIILFSVHTNFVSKHVLMSMPPSVRRQCTNGISFEVKLPFSLFIGVGSAQFWRSGGTNLVRIAASNCFQETHKFSTLLHLRKKNSKGGLNALTGNVFFLKHNHLYY